MRCSVVSVCLRRWPGKHSQMLGPGRSVSMTREDFRYGCTAFREREAFHPSWRVTGRDPAQSSNNWQMLRTRWSHGHLQDADGQEKPGGSAPPWPACSLSPLVWGRWQIPNGGPSGCSANFPNTSVILLWTLRLLVTANQLGCFPGMPWAPCYYCYCHKGTLCTMSWITCAVNDQIYHTTIRFPSDGRKLPKTVCSTVQKNIYSSTKYLCGKCWLHQWAQRRLHKATLVLRVHSFIQRLIPAGLLQQPLPKHAETDAWAAVICDVFAHQINSRMNPFRLHFIEPSRTLWIRTSLLVSYWQRPPKRAMAVTRYSSLRLDFGGETLSHFFAPSCVGGHMSTSLQLQRYRLKSSSNYYYLFFFNEILTDNLFRCDALQSIIY